MSVKNLYRTLKICFLLAVMFPGSAMAAGMVSEGCDIVRVYHPQQLFLTPAEEVSYFSRYHPCWATALIMAAQPSRYHFLGEGLELFSRPEYVSALSFSKYLCEGIVNGGRLIRRDYACFIEKESAAKGESLEDAVKKEAPKVLISTLIKGNRSNDTVEYVLCLNDDPTKPKEYTKGCRRGIRMEITEFGRGDLNKDGVEDLIVRVRYSQNKDSFKRCYMAVFTRKNGELFKMINYSPVGQCQ